MAVKIKTGGEDKPKPTKVKVAKPSPKELEAANNLAKDIAVRRGLVSGLDTHTGGQIPKFIDDRTGKELVAGAPSPQLGSLSANVPAYVKELSWDKTTNQPYYVDEQTGYIKYVPKDLFYSTRFNPNKGIAANALAKR